MSTTITTKPFPWRAGMRCRFEDWDALVRILSADHEEAWVIHENAEMPLAFVCSLDSLHSPDGKDGATKGALLEAARGSWNCDDYRRLSIEPAGSGFCVVVRNGRHRPPSKAQPGWDLDKVAHPPYRNVPSPFAAEYATEFDALMAAWEVTP